MRSKWAEKELKKCDLGDERLNHRLILLADSFSQAPESPINQACQNWAETKAAYRFFQNENVSHQKVLNSHVEATKERAQEYSVILAIQDTTYFNYSAHPKTKGLCALSKNKGKHKKEIVTTGLVMHTTLAVSTEGLPLGILNQKTYSRPPLSEEIKDLKKRSHNIALPIEEKDSFRWLQCLQETHKIFKTQATQVVTVCDREADIYDFFRLADKLKTPVLVRASHNRTVNKNSIYSEITGVKLWDLLNNTKSRGIIRLDIPEQEDRPSRSANCEVKIRDFTLTPPKNHTEKHVVELPFLKIHAIHVSEVNPPEGCAPIDWMLLYNLPIKDYEEALEKINWYCIRWRIEVFHKVLKSGLKVEDCRLATADRLIRYLTLMSIVAWRIFWITLVARVAPNSSCLLFLSNMEWRILFSQRHRNKKMSKKPPSAKEAVQWIAQLGGFLARKGDQLPGITHIWRGLNKFANLIEGVEIAKGIYG
jgi:hypothetical protein